MLVSRLACLLTLRPCRLPPTNRNFARGYATHCTLTQINKTAETSVSK
jgi:hypothetical protein